MTIKTLQKQVKELRAVVKAQEALVKELQALVGYLKLQQAGSRRLTSPFGE